MDRQELLKCAKPIESINWGECNLTVIGDGYLGIGRKIYVVVESLPLPIVEMANCYIISISDIITCEIHEAIKENMGCEIEGNNIVFSTKSAPDIIRSILGKYQQLGWFSYRGD